MDELVAQLLVLAVAWSGYPAPATMPAVHIVSAARIPCPCAGFYAYITRFHSYGAAPERTGEVLLRDDVDLHGLYGRSILLHELVHALQGQQGAAEYGSGLWYRREREAYRIQYRFLRASRFAERNDRRLPAGED
jgi:hypothetical protein